MSSENNDKVLETEAKRSIVQDSSEALEKIQNEDVLPSSHTTEVQLENGVHVTEVLSLEFSEETGKGANEAAIETVVQSDVIIQSDVSNKAQSDIISMSAIAAAPSQVFFTFEMDGDANSAKVGGEFKRRVTKAKQFVTMETATCQIMTSLLTRQPVMLTS